MTLFGNFPILLNCFQFVCVKNSVMFMTFVSCVGNGALSVRKQRVINPFDAALLDQLDGPVFMSPGVFTSHSTPASDEKVSVYSP